MKKKNESSLGSFKAPNIGPLETKVMEIIWQNGQMSVRDVAEAMKSEGEPAYTTVMTIMNRLVEKGFLERVTSGRAYLYTAKVSREAYSELRARLQARGLIEQFGEVAVAQFAAELKDVDPERARRLGDLLSKEPGR